jgi:hypothetical protein
MTTLTESRNLDRRRQPTPMFSRYTLLGGKRRGGRRRGESLNQFVDRHGKALLLVTLLVAAFNLLDGYFTLFYLGEGASEANPVADFLLRQGHWIFILAKSLGIGLCLAFLCLAKNFRLARAGMALVFLMYFLLSGYHISLMLHHLPHL